MDSKRLSPQDALPRMTEILNSGGSFRLTVTGSSMSPFLRHQQDAVILAPISGPLKPGDILFYLRAPQVCILHRVHQLCPDKTLLMCGDAQTQLEPIREAQVLARVSHIERAGKRFSSDALPWQVSCTLWRWLHPVRPYLLAILRKLGYV